MTNNNQKKQIRFDRRRGRGRGRFVGHRQADFIEEEVPSNWEDSFSEIGSEGSAESEVACYVAQVLPGAQLSTPSKKSIHLKLKLGEVNAIALLDGGATNNFVSRHFLKKHHMNPAQLDQPLVCKLGDGVTEVTHQLSFPITVQGRIFQEQFYVMNQGSSQPIVLGFDFLQTKQVTIAYGGKTVMMAGEELECQQQGLSALNVKKISDDFLIPCKQQKGIGVLSLVDVILGSGQVYNMPLGWGMDRPQDVRIVSRKSISLRVFDLQHTGQEAHVQLYNQSTKKKVRIKRGSLLGYLHVGNGE